MQLNSVVFPAPECSYSLSDFSDEMIFIPREFDRRKVVQSQNVQKRTISYNRDSTASSKLRQSQGFYNNQHESRKRNRMDSLPSQPTLQ